MAVVSVQDGGSWWKFLFAMAVRLVLFEVAVFGSNFCLRCCFMVGVSNQSSGW
jgi:hypothetical protein